ncbi:peptidoglycan deacetylase [Sulfodiicoccus acidiphilus]|uniref:Peptidoglycan deacetylase n=1 Tax=Sulfodiicoccus acidiphilus TaxID=1670455 RepID=A0A348B622_9CREN|nr:polysaccharide deacetylase [Sulfodiicoccus acidiphilus]BBD73624.1 peptidoglycan deacetylase [Sulfodiicoccus acidiphilus]GGU04688.1 peptidoglycan deacetylase [Sulfodiicoccus acidiphilus]
MKEIFVSIGADADSVAGWLGSYGGQDSPHDISRGVYASEVGIPRLLSLFKRKGIKVTWFLPGHTVESFPEETMMIYEHEHEIGAHGYSHENPVSMTPEQEEAVLVRSIELIRDLTGKKPVGNTAPWWEMSSVTVELLLKHGFKYDRSMADNDFQPFYARVNRRWTKIDYSKPAKEWMKPIYLGDLVDLVEYSANWMLDDLPPMMFNKHACNSYGFTNPRDIEQIWRDEFDWMYRNYDYAVFPLTIHPDVSGRPEVALMLERFIDYINTFPGVRWATYEEVTEDFRRRKPFQKALEEYKARQQRIAEYQKKLSK